MPEEASRTRPLYDVVIGNVVIGAVVLYYLSMVVLGEIEVSATEWTLGAVLIVFLLLVRIRALPQFIRWTIFFASLAIVGYWLSCYVAFFI